MQKFSAGDRVLISRDFYWARGATGTISGPPAEVTEISGTWDGGLTRQELSALGEATVYWVWFDESRSGTPTAMVPIAEDRLTRTR